MNASTVLSWIPGWLGFLALSLVGAAMTINGAVNKGLNPANAQFCRRCGQYLPQAQRVAVRRAAMW